MLYFFLVVGGLTLLLPAAVVFSYDRGWLAEVPSFLIETTLLMAFMTSVIFVYLYRRAKPALFVQLYLLSMVVKLLACFAYNLLIILEDRTGAILNVAYFVAAYIIFTAVEIAFLYARISGSSRS